MGDLGDKHLHLARTLGAHEVGLVEDDGELVASLGEESGLFGIVAFVVDGELGAQEVDLRRVIDPH